MTFQYSLKGYHIYYNANSCRGSESNWIHYEAYIDNQNSQQKVVVVVVEVMEYDDNLHLVARYPLASIRFQGDNVFLCHNC